MTMITKEDFGFLSDSVASILDQVKYICVQNAMQKQTSYWKFQIP